MNGVSVGRAPSLSRARCHADAPRHVPLPFNNAASLQGKAKINLPFSAALLRLASPARPGAGRGVPPRGSCLRFITPRSEPSAAAFSGAGA